MHRFQRLRQFSDWQVSSCMRRNGMGNSASEQFAQFLCTWADIPDSEISKALEIFQPVSVSTCLCFQRNGSRACWCKCILVWDLCIRFRCSPKRRHDTSSNSAETTLENRCEQKILLIRRPSTRLSALRE